jgi:deoxyribodipyrimidine photolyase-like uncharacterized protein
MTGAVRRWWAGGQRRLLLEDFYREQRRRHGVLMDDSEPVTGRLNYDVDNREGPPRGVTRLDVVPPWEPEEDEIDDEVRRDLDAWERNGVIETVGRGGLRRFADACLYTAGYWWFLQRNRTELARNHRMRQPLRSFDRLSDLVEVVEQEAARGSAAP